MNIGNEHKMVVKNTFPTGAQEWYCPTCGRRFILQWPPNYKRIILNEGDEQAIHSGGTGGMVLGAAQAESPEPLAKDEIPSEFTDLDDPYLSPWARWLGDQDI